jgi:type IX secretion system PorP/SprF family membrane protein
MSKPFYFLIKIVLPAMVALSPIKAIQAQQNIQFTQYMFNGLVINPAYAGADEALSLTLLHRNQWSGIDGAPSTQTFSAHTLFRKKHIGLGLTLVNDKIGVHKNIAALSNYAYHLQTGKNSYFSFGLQAGVHNRKSDYSSLVGSTSNNDPKLFNTLISSTYFNFGMGLYFRSPRLHVGFSSPELLTEMETLNDSVSIELSKVHSFLYAKYRITLNENVEFEPSLLLKYLAGVPLSYDVNVNMIFREVLTMGVSYRKDESVDFLLKAQLTRQLQVGYSYDHPIGEISRLSSGSHELMINYLFRYTKSNVTSPR